MDNMRPMLPYLARYKRTMVSMVLVILLGAGLTILQPNLLGQAIDSLRDGQPGETTGWLAVAILGLAVVQGLFTFLMRFVSGRMSRRIEYELRRDLFAHLETMPQSFYGEMHTGDLMARATNDLSAV